MARRGRPRHPDILTPREWEVLALVREGLSNEQIAERVDITERTARFHVSEILGKLGVATRQEAAAWQPEERRPWWDVVAVPLLFWRRTGLGWAAAGLGAAVLVAASAGLGVLAWGVLRSHGGGPPLGPADLAVGQANTCVLMHGGVKCWGDNLYGTVGDGTQGLNLHRSTPVQVVGLTSGVSAISAGAAHVCALMAQGTVKCWGSNASGLLGNGDSGGAVQNKFSPAPVDVVGLSSIAAISAGSGHVCALTSAGGVKCWGTTPSASSAMARPPFAARRSTSSV